MAKKLKPVSIAGIEFDALMDETKNLSSTIPAYPVESGFSTSDAIILDPIALAMTLYVSRTPVTWLYRHGTSADRVKKVCDMLEKVWYSKQLVKVVTTDAIYKDMGITSISFRKSSNMAYAKEIQISLQKVEVTQVMVTDIPAYILQSGDTGTNAGAATTSTTSDLVTEGASTGGSVGISDKYGGYDEEGETPKRAQSILYGVASGLGLI